MPDARWIRRLTLRVRTLLLRDRVEQELDEEVRFHVEERIAAEVARGLSPQEARRIAVLAMDGVDQTKEACRDTRRTQAIEHVFRDVRYALRSLARSPAFAAIAILSLALGMGANTAIFSIVDKLLLESLPVRNPRELVLLNPAGLRNGWTAGSRTWSYPAYRGLREHQRVFAGLIAERTDAVNLTVDGATQRALASIVSGNYFDVLGVRPLQGRLFGDDDDRIRSGHPVAVLSHGFWVERFGGSSDIIGRTLRVGGHPFTVIGITERGFNGLEVGASVDLFVPTMMLPDVVTYTKALDERTAYIFQLYGRLASGVGRQQAEGQLRPLYLAELEQDVAAMGNRAPAGNDWKRGTLLLEDGHRGTSGLRRDLGTPLIAVMAMTIVLLLTACANIAGLQTARASARLKEISIRLAMGASRGRILQQLLTESAVIALLGALAGLWIAWLTIRLLVAEMGDTGERLRLFTTFLDARALAFTFVFAAATGLAFGLLPALFATRPEVWPGLKSGIVADVGGQARLRRVLVTAQLALSLVLVAASGLFGRTLLNLRHADTGFQTERLIQFQLNPGAAGYDRARSETLLHQVVDDLQSVPGVGRATLAVAPVLSNGLIGFSLDVEGYSSREGTRARAVANVVAPGYFGIVGTPLVRGREFSATDTARSRRVAIVSDRFVRRYLPNLDPLGRTIGLAYGGPARFYYEIVGVAKDARLNNLRDEPPPTFYLPYTQFDVLNSSFVLARIQTDPDLLRRPIEAVVRRRDPELPVVAYSTVDEQIDRLLRPERLVASVSLAFGLLATGLGAMGLYGVVAFTVARRTREIGVRMALGAARGAVVRMVLRGVAGMAAIGICAGVVLSFVLARYVESQLYGVRGRDLATLGAAAALFVIVALASGWLPARKASRVDPMLALRQD
jgi:predicted permease